MPIFKAIYKALSGKWHPQAVTVGPPVEMDELCKQISMMTTVSAPDAKAAIEALGMVMGSFMNSGRTVHVDGLGTFYYTCVSNCQGVDTDKEVDSNQITGTRVRFIPESTRKGRTVTRAPSATTSCGRTSSPSPPWTAQVKVVPPPAAAAMKVLSAKPGIKGCRPLGARAAAFNEVLTGNNL